MGLYTFIIKKTQPVFAGINYWIIASMAIGFGYLLMGLRGSIPNSISILVSNDLFVLAGFLRIIGLNKFFNKPMQLKLVATIVVTIVLYTLGLGYFTYFFDNIYLRTILIGICISTLSVYTGILLLNNIPAKGRYVYYFVSGTFFTFAFIFIFRIVGWVFFPSVRGLFVTGFVNTIQFMSSMAIDILWTTMFFVIHNQRLNMQLQESEEKFRTIFEENSSALAIIEPDTSIAMVNDEYTRLSGYTKEEVKGLSWTTQITEEDLERLKEYNRNRLSNTGDAPEKYEFSFYKKTGEKVHALMSIALIPGINNIIASFTDITERKKTELQLQQMANELKVLNANKNLFFSIMAHDLKNPFNTIILLSDLLLENPDINSSAKNKTDVGIINSLSRQTYYLLEDLLSWVKSQDGKMKPKPSEFNLIALIHEAVEKESVHLSEKKITIVSPVGQMIVYVDEFMVNTIIRNLITNAIKYTHRGGKIEISVKPDSRYITVTITDNGIGIKEENISKLFTITEKLITRGTENERGNGLGLILCTEFVEKLGGSIWVDSEFGKGSSFSFTIPQKNR
jgi:PAS domain S-box-containing protein